MATGSYDLRPVITDRAGNTFTGVELAANDDDPATSNDVQGNLIGTTAAGDARLANGSTAVWVSASGSNEIGGSAVGAGNVISGNGGDGVSLVFGANGTTFR